MKPAYIYHGVVKKRYKGDCVIEFDLGFGVRHTTAVLMDVIGTHVDLGQEIDIPFLASKTRKTALFVTTRVRASTGYIYVATPVILEARPYRYYCWPEKVYDGDTVTRAVIDLGFNIKVVDKFRLYGINTPELRGDEKEAGKVSRDFLKSQVLKKKTLVETLKTTSTWTKKGKYGRYLGTLYRTDRKTSINDTLVKKGLAQEYLI